MVGTGPDIASLRWHYPDQVRGYVSPGVGAGTPSVWAAARSADNDADYSRCGQAMASGGRRLFGRLDDAHDATDLENRMAGWYRITTQIDLHEPFVLRQCPNQNIGRTLA